MKFLVLCALFGAVFAHTWMSCPWSFDVDPGRPADTVGPCENEKVWHGVKYPNEYKAGDRMKVGWTSNNHAGGWVRIALAPYGQHKTHKAFDDNVMKITCYGHDQRPGQTIYGDCKHPCNARAGCEYQAYEEDNARFDTTVKIPHNLADGDYVLQIKSAMSSHPHFYYSCARVKVTGGNPNMKCPQSKLIVVPGCLKGTAVELKKYTENSKPAQFCYREDGPGYIDADMYRVPKNVQCDPRITCAVSIDGKGCKGQHKMADITNDWKPEQICGEVKPAPAPTCDDGVKNQGEERIDCGGPCPACPVTMPPTTPADRVYSKFEFKKIAYASEGYINGNAIVHVRHAVKKWRMTLFFDRKVEISQHWGGKLVSVNEFKTVYVFENKSWNGRVPAGGKVNVGFEGKFPTGAVDTPNLMGKDFVEP